MKNKDKKTKPLGIKDLYAAVDLHGDNGYYCVINDRDECVFEQRLPNDLPKVLKALEPYRERLAKGIAVESTFNWYWLVDGLQAHQYTVQLVNTTQVQTYSGLKSADDQSDAFWLAHLQRLGILPTGYIYPLAQRGARDLLRRRMLLVQQRTAQLLSFKCLIERQTGRMISGNQVKALEPEEVGQWVAGVEVELMGQTSLRMIEFIGTQIRSLEKAAQAKIKLLPDYDRLKQIPGIGEILNLVIMLETGPITRFAGAGQYVSYCRGAKSEKLSNGRKKGENNRKCGNKYLAWAWMEAANFALRYSPEIKQWYQRKLARCGKVVVARKALAAKLAKAAYYMLKNQEAFKLEKLLG
ncbi:MAG: IS110 family transposase [Verrucomicrobiota bacterium]